MRTASALLFASLLCGLPASASPTSQLAVPIVLAQATSATPTAAEKPAVKTVQAAPRAKKRRKGFFEKIAPILILLFVVGIVIARLPKVEGITHSKAYRRRRILNWLPLGITYAFLYMGRYNLTVSKSAFGDIVGPGGQPLMTVADFSQIFAVGTMTYGVSFLLNGPLTDRFGGKFAILAGGAGAALANALMGYVSYSLIHDGVNGFLGNHLVLVFSILYAMNMYFQSFGAVAIVKCNAPWFHVRERGVFGAIFGILISLGIYLAFDIGGLITKSFPLYWVFFTPAAMLGVFWVINFLWVKNSPKAAGLDDFDTADASSGDDGPRLGVVAVFKKMMKNRVIMTIAFIEFCSGWLRQSIMNYYKIFAKQTDALLGERSSFVYENWGMVLCCAGILGGVFAGIISDRVFQSRRGPVAAVLYGLMLGGSVLLVFVYDTSIVGYLALFMSMCVIGVHGMLSGTASMDFGGRRNVGVAVGIIDGFVYAGTGVMALTYSFILPSEQLNELGQRIGPATDPANWQIWPISMIPLATIGLYLASKVWNAKPKGKKAAAH